MFFSAVNEGHDGWAYAVTIYVRVLGKDASQCEKGPEIFPEAGVIEPKENSGGQNGKGWWYPLANAMDVGRKWTRAFDTAYQCAGSIVLSRFVEGGK